MLCISARRRMLEYHGGELMGPARDKLERHLSRCRGCREYLQALDADLRKIREAVGEGVEPPPADALWQRIEQGLPPRPQLRRPATRPLAVGAVCVVLAAVGVLLTVGIGRGPMNALGNRLAQIPPDQRRVSRIPAPYVSEPLPGSVPSHPKRRYEPMWKVDSVDVGSGMVVLVGEKSADVRRGDTLRVFALGRDERGKPKRTWWCDVVVKEVTRGRLVCLPKPAKGQSVSTLLSGMRKGWQASKLAASH